MKQMIAAMAALVGMSALVRAQAPPEAVRVGQVKSENLAQMRRVTGDVHAVRRALVATRAEGLVIEMLAREGQRVALGEPLARLDPTLLELEDGVLRARLTAAEALLAERRRTHERTQQDLEIVRRLAESEAANPKELTDAEAEEAVARARAEQAQADIARLAAESALLEQRRRDTVVRAPFAGTVVARHCEVGAWLGVGGGVCELVSDDELELWLDLPESEYAGLRSNGDAADAVQVTIEASGAQLELADRRMVPLVDERSRRFRMILPVPPSATRGLAAGMSAIAYVPTKERADALLVPVASILRNDVGPFVWAVREVAPDAPPQVFPVPIEVLWRTADGAVVRPGTLAPGTAVVVEGNERLFPGAAVLPTPAGAGGAGAVK